MAFGILADVDLLGAETVAAQEDEVPERQEDAPVLEEFYLLVGDGHVPHMLHLLAQQVGETFGIDFVVAVEEGIFDFGARVGLQYVVLAGEGVEVVVGEVRYQWFHVWNWLWSV